MPRESIKQGVRELLPAHPDQLIDQYIDSALTQLIKRYVRHYRAEDEFCLTFEERKRIASRLADVEKGDDDLRVAIAALVKAATDQIRGSLPMDSETLTAATKRALDLVLWQRGEVFAAAVHRDQMDLDYPDLQDVAKAVAREAGPNPAVVDSRITQVIVAAAESALTEPSPEVQQYLRSFADAYTLFAFMRETPDVQGAVSKMFDDGEIWIDTTVVLPLFAEELSDSPMSRLYTNLLSAARESGLSLFITPGVLEEIDSHMRKCVAYGRHSGRVWEGRVPFLAAAFALTGRSRGQLPTWLERFRGGVLPQEDIAQYLTEAWGIEVRSLDFKRLEAPQSLSEGLSKRSGMRPTNAAGVTRAPTSGTATPQLGSSTTTSRTTSAWFVCGGGSTDLLLATRRGGSPWIERRSACGIPSQVDLPLATFRPRRS